MSRAPVEKYRAIIGAFVHGSATAEEFEQDFLRSFKSEEALGEEVFVVLDRLFADVDAFCADPNLRDEEDLDEVQLRARCVTALSELELLDKEE